MTKIIGIIYNYNQTMAVSFHCQPTTYMKR